MTEESTARQRFGSSDVLIDELFDTTHRLRVFVDGRLREHGASVARLRTLRVLALAGEPLRMRDLAEHVGNAARTTTTIVDSLERDGLVERVRHPTDRRAFLLALTPEGVRRHREAEELDRAALAAATGTLSDTERGQLRALLGRVRTAVADAGGGADGATDADAKEPPSGE
ncbi:MULTISPECIES: MarR family transcriptional regulator [Kitasatospora]|uniref:Putative MarR family transcriptional regulator n=1 Tax=Kitasatospora setae (strain ATCC 33774 / DSM 43861 / JCM 3304 / KCC A-0304 / NBRC 14216 / KM-6054) TaxID=452652 RepID=E4NK00_KITSK|nr:MULTISPECIES: MarR family transcriptional regulator [Kitasatospora]BAJ33298.1 putative MarR family transcriptional regulator [Kitasatospora setae KM-6054]